MGDPGAYPKDYRVTIAVAVGAVLALGWVETRMRVVAAQEIAPVKQDVAALQARDRLVQQKLDALCRATAANCPLGVE
jgi:hypothetical protein